MNKFELNKALKVGLNEFDKTINPFQRDDVLFVHSSEYPENIQVETNEILHDNQNEPSKTTIITDSKSNSIAKNVVNRNSNSHYFVSNFNDGSSMSISHNIYCINYKMINEVTVNITNPTKGQVTEISYNVSTGTLTSYIVENGMNVTLAEDEVRDKLLQILAVATNYAKSITIDNLIDNGYSKTLNYSER